MTSQNTLNRIRKPPSKLSRLALKMPGDLEPIAARERPNPILPPVRARPFCNIPPNSFRTPERRSDGVFSGG